MVYDVYQIDPQKRDKYRKSSMAIRLQVAIESWS